MLFRSFFDARLSDYSDGVLTLDFLDAAKFAAEHDYSHVRNSERQEKVGAIAQNILGILLAIVIKSGK